MAIPLQERARDLTRAGLTTALLVGVVDTTFGALVGGHPLWSAASWPIAVAWSVAVFAVVMIALVACLVAASTFLKTSTIAEGARATLELVVGRGESWLAALPLGVLMWGLPPLVEGAVTELIVGQQLPGMLGSIASSAGALALAWLAHRILARVRPRWATRPRVAALLFVAHVYGQVPDVALVAPFSTWPALLPVGLGLIVVLASIPDESRARLASTIAAGVAALALAGGAASYEARSAEHAALTKGATLYLPAVRAVWLASDWDADRHSGWFGGGDCAGFDGQIHPGALEDPETPADEDCRPTEGALEAAKDEAAEDGAASEGSDAESEGDAADEAGAEGAPEPRARNIILLTVDALRADHVGLEIEGRSLTPKIDAFFAKGHRFERAYSPSTHTQQSLPSILTGTHLTPGTETDPGPAPHSMAAFLQGVNYSTAGVLSLPEISEVMVDGLEYVDNEIGQRPQVWQKVTAYESVFRAVKVLEASRQTGRPLFLWVHFLDPHAYYAAESKYADWLGDDSLRAHYRHEVHRTDDALGELFLALEDLGYLRDSVVALTSDHGESFGEHGSFTHVWEGYETVARVPLLVRMPGDDELAVHDEVTSLVDLAPTLLDLVGIGVETDPAHGRSVRPLLEGREMPPKPAHFHAFYQGRQILYGRVDVRYKVLVDAQRNAFEFYDLREDPEEHRNLVDAEAERFEPREAALWRWWERVTPPPPGDE